MAGTGLRFGTAMALAWRDVRIDEPPFEIIVPPEKMKSRRMHRVPLGEPTAVGLRRERSRGDIEPENKVFRHVRREVLVRDAVEAGVPKVDRYGRTMGFHCFRRMVATELARQRVNPKVAQELLGHSDVLTTMRHYTDTKLLASSEPLESLTERLEAMQNGGTE